MVFLFVCEAKKLLGLQKRRLIHVDSQSVTFILTKIYDVYNKLNDFYILENYMIIIYNLNVIMHEHDKYSTYPLLKI